LSFLKVIYFRPYLKNKIQATGLDVWPKALCSSVQNRRGRVREREKGRRKRRGRGRGRERKRRNF
jgi:hypothetical protein